MLDTQGYMTTKNAFWETRNGYRVVLELWRDESPYADGGVPDYGEWSWVASLNGHDCTAAALRSREMSYPSITENEAAIKRLRAYVDSLPSGAGPDAQF